MEKESQSKKILAYMMSGNSITAVEALNMFGCFRLASRITDLRQAGHPITSRWVVNEWGTKFKSYSYGVFKQ